MPVSIVDIFKLGKLMICKRMTGFNNYFFFFQIKPHKFDEYTAFLFIYFLAVEFDRFVCFYHEDTLYLNRFYFFLCNVFWIQNCCGCLLFYRVSVIHTGMHVNVNISFLFSIFMKLYNNFFLNYHTLKS